MEFDSFRQKYPLLTREQIAEIAGCKVSLVNRWYMSAETRMEPSDLHKMRFALADWLWTQESLQPAFFGELRRIRATFP